MRARTPKEEPLATTSNFHHGLLIILRVIQTLYGGRCSHLPSDGGRKQEEDEDSLYRIIQEIFINLVFVKFIDLLPLRLPHLLYLSPRMTLVTVHFVNIFTFCNKVRMLSMPWGRVSCACTATSVAMVICAHSPRLIEPLCRDSP